MTFVTDIWYITNGDVAFTMLALVAFLLAIYLAIVPHEIAHGLVAKWNGDLTAKMNGRLSLNPIVHLDPIGFLMLLTVGFGYAKPVPVNPYNFKVPRRGLFTVAIAGVTYNLLATILSSFFLALIMFLSPVIENVYMYFFLSTFFELLATINLTLFLFNIIPLGHLDGFKIIEAYAHRENRFIGFLRRYGSYILIALFALHFAVHYIQSYAGLEFLQYFDILGLYLNTCSYWIGNGILSLFTMMFGLGPVF
ncbi:MAG: site-2 protease family protein [Clostridia bacterium]|nr:site-2 protease family protein [Clostridia bacterium]